MASSPSSTSPDQNENDNDPISSIPNTGRTSQANLSKDGAGAHRKQSRTLTSSAKRPSSAVSSTSRSSLGRSDSKKSVTEINSGLLRTIDNVFGEYMRKDKSLKRLVTTPDVLIAGNQKPKSNTNAPRQKRASVQKKSSTKLPLSFGPTPVLVPIEDENESSKPKPSNPAAVPEKEEETQFTPPNPIPTDQHQPGKEADTIKEDEGNDEEDSTSLRSTVTRVLDTSSGIPLDLPQNQSQSNFSTAILSELSATINSPADLSMVEVKRPRSTTSNSSSVFSAGEAEDMMGMSMEADHSDSPAVSKEPSSQECSPSENTEEEKEEENDHVEPQSENSLKEVELFQLQFVGELPQSSSSHEENEQHHHDEDEIPAPVEKSVDVGETEVVANNEGEIKQEKENSGRSFSSSSSAKVAPEHISSFVNQYIDSLENDWKTRWDLWLEKNGNVQESKEAEGTASIYSFETFSDCVASRKIEPQVPFDLPEVQEDDEGQKEKLVFKRRPFFTRSRSKSPSRIPRGKDSKQNDNSSVVSSTNDEQKSQNDDEKVEKMDAAAAATTSLANPSGNEEFAASQIIKSEDEIPSVDMITNPPPVTAMLATISHTNVASILKECGEDEWEDLKRIMGDKRERDNEALDDEEPTDGQLCANTVDKIISTFARRYIDFLEKEWSRRRTVWLETVKLSASKEDYDDSAYHYETFGECIANNRMKLQVPFELPAVTKCRKNPVLLDGAMNEPPIVICPPAETATSDSPTSPPATVDVIVSEFSISPPLPDEASVVKSTDAVVEKVESRDSSTPAYAPIVVREEQASEITAIEGAPQPAKHTSWWDSLFSFGSAESENQQKPEEVKPAALEQESVTLAAKPTGAAEEERFVTPKESPVSIDLLPTIYEKTEESNDNIAQPITEEALLPVEEVKPEVLADAVVTENVGAGELSAGKPSSLESVEKPVEEPDVSDIIAQEYSGEAGLSDITPPASVKGNSDEDIAISKRKVKFVEEIAEVTAPSPIEEIYKGLSRENTDGSLKDSFTPPVFKFKAFVNGRSVECATVEQKTRLDICCMKLNTVQTYASNLHDMTVLPGAQVLRFLNLQDYKNCRLVSKSWNNAVIASKKFLSIASFIIEKKPLGALATLEASRVRWQNIRCSILPSMNFSASNTYNGRFLSNVRVTPMSSRSEPLTNTLTTVLFDGIDINRQQLMTWIQNCKRLSSVHIRGCNFLKSTVSVNMDKANRVMEKIKSMTFSEMEVVKLAEALRFFLPAARRLHTLEIFQRRETKGTVKSATFTARKGAEEEVAAVLCPALKRNSKTLKNIAFEFTSSKNYLLQRKIVETLGNTIFSLNTLVVRSFSSQNNSQPCLKIESYGSSSSLTAVLKTTLRSSSEMKLLDFPMLAVDFNHGEAGTRFLPPTLEKLAAQLLLPMQEGFSTGLVLPRMDELELYGAVPLEAHQWCHVKLMMPGLTQLVVQSPGLRDSHLQAIIKNLKSLKVLYLENVADITDFGITGMEVAWIDRLKMYWPEKYDQIPRDKVRYAGKPLSVLADLQSFIMKGNFSISNVGILFGFNSREMTTLELTGSPVNASNSGMFILGFQCPRLRRLRMTVQHSKANPSGVRNLYDSLAEKISSQFQVDLLPCLKENDAGRNNPMISQH